MSDHIDDYMAQVHNFDFAQGEQSAALENAFQQANNSENRERAGGDNRNLVNDVRYFTAENTQDSNANGGMSAHPVPAQFNREGGHQFDGTRNNYQPSNGDVRDHQRGGYGERTEHGNDERNNNGQSSASASHNGSSASHNQPQYSSNSVPSVAALPIPAMALQVSSLSGGAFVPNPALQQQPQPPQHQHGPPPAPIMEGPLLKSRCVEEEYAVIIHRSASASAKSSNTKYRCLFCNFTFVGGPQKIRVHLTGKRENGTRLSKCENCPEDIRRRLEERMKAPKEMVNEIGLYDDDDASTPSLPARNVEEQHTIVLSRSQSSNSKSSNTRYKCIYCRFKFVGGPQKIRVHLTGQQEGGTRMTKCARVPEDVMEQMEHRRKAPKPDVLSTPGGLPGHPTPLPLPHLGGDPDMHPALSSAQAIQNQHAYAIQQQQQALLLKQQQQHAQQLQLQQQQLQILQRQQQMQLHQQQQQQQMHQQHIQHLQQIHQQQQLHQQQQQQQMHQQHIQLPHGAGAMHGAPHPSAQMHPAHLHQQQHLMHLGQPPTSAAQLMMQQQHHQQQLQQQQRQHQQQQMQHPHLPHHQQIPQHLIFHSAQVNAAAQHAQHAQSLQSHALHQHQQQQQQLHQQQLLAHPHLLQGAGHHLPNLEFAEHDEAAVAAYHAEILAAQSAAANGDTGSAEQGQGQGQRQTEHQQS
jgi:hypothetical protein